MADIEKNRQTIIRFLREVWSKADLETVDEILDPDFKFILAFAVIENREGFKKLLAVNHTVFQNLTYHVDDDEGDVVADESRGAGFWRMTSKHIGTWRNVPASNADVNIKGITFFKFSPEGRLTEARVQNDVLSMMKQIGGVKMLYE